MGRVKGGKISNKLAFLREHYGEEMLNKVLDSMDPSDQMTLKMVLDTAWYDIDLYDRLLVSICKTAAGGDETIYMRIGYYSAEQSFTTTYKVFRGKDPEDLIQKLASMHGMRNDPADIKIIKHEPGHCILRVAQPKSTIERCKMGLAFYVRAIQLCGASSVKAKETHCSGKGDPFCQFDLRWH